MLDASASHPPPPMLEAGAPTTCPRAAMHTRHEVRVAVCCKPRATSGFQVRQQEPREVETLGLRITGQLLLRFWICDGEEEGKVSLCTLPLAAWLACPQSVDKRLASGDGSVSPDGAAPA